jgi:hypothetical protein
LRSPETSCSPSEQSRKTFDGPIVSVGTLNFLDDSFVSHTGLTEGSDQAERFVNDGMKRSVVHLDRHWERAHAGLSKEGRSFIALYFLGDQKGAS